MQVMIGKSKLELVEGDITQQDTEAIVNAANSSLLGGGGVDGAIHRAGGPQVLAECRKVGGCPPGEARITSGGRLRAKYVIHTVGPVYSSTPRDGELLARCYWRSLLVASENRLRSVAFPSISTGAYGYPLHKAAPVALQTVTEYLKTHTDVELVRFVLFDERTYEAYRMALECLPLPLQPTSKH